MRSVRSVILESIKGDPSPDRCCKYNSISLTLLPYGPSQRSGKLNPAPSRTLRTSKKTQPRDQTSVEPRSKRDSRLCLSGAAYLIVLAAGLLPASGSCPNQSKL